VCVSSCIGGEWHLHFRGAAQSPPLSPSRPLSLSPSLPLSLSLSLSRRIFDLVCVCVSSGDLIWCVCEQLRRRRVASTFPRGSSSTFSTSAFAGLIRGNLFSIRIRQRKLDSAGLVPAPGTFFLGFGRWSRFGSQFSDLYRKSFRWSLR
jgi:hypothetical protein